MRWKAGLILGLAVAAAVLLVGVGPTIVLARVRPRHVLEGEGLLLFDHEIVHNPDENLPLRGPRST